MEPNKNIKDHPVVSETEWLEARLKLLKAEKELTHRSDEVARQRQEMPWVHISKKYFFDTDAGKASLTDLFKGRTQLLIYHFMYGPEYQAGCPTCSTIADGFDGFAIHLAHHDVMLWAVSRAPLKTLQQYKQRMGWSFPWASSFGSDFNYDFNVSFTEEQQRQGKTFHNYHQGNVSSQIHEIAATDAIPAAGNKLAATVGTDWLTYIRELPGMSAFVLRGGEVYHTYSAYERGLDGLWGMYQWLDRAPFGRNEAGDTKWFHRHDEYENGAGNKSEQGSCCS